MKKEGRYLYHLTTKLNFYKQILEMINNNKNIYDITFVESAIDLAFPGSKLDNDFLSMLTLEIETSTKEISQYCNSDRKTKETIFNNQIEQRTKETEAINKFNYELELARILVENDQDNINNIINKYGSHEYVDGFVDVRVKAIKERLKTR